MSDEGESVRIDIEGWTYISELEGVSMTVVEDARPEASLGIKLEPDSFRSIASSVADAIHASVLDPPAGLSPFISSTIVINYISAGYVLLPWGEWYPASLVGT
jgi:hypothetical protein